MTNPVETAASQVIGIVDSVSTDKIIVHLNAISPQATALNAGGVQRFPRINGLVLIPSEVGYAVGTITWIGIERAPIGSIPRDSRQQLVDLPQPDRKMSVTLLGTLQWNEAAGLTELSRGVSSYPTVGDSVLIPTPQQAEAIAQGDKNARVPIGTSPLTGDIEVKIDPDKLFGRHLAILGNTGSGKSCTVAGLIRWCLEEAAADAMTDENRRNRAPNSRFIVLDPNGEYGKAFADIPNTTIVNISADADAGAIDLKVPGWLWNSQEWASVLSAKPGVQRPVLNEALRTLRSGLEQSSTPTVHLDRTIRGYHARTRESFNSGQFTDWPHKENFGQMLANCRRDLVYFDIETHYGADGRMLLDTVTNVLNLPGQSYTGKNGETRYKDFSGESVDGILEAFNSVAALLPDLGAEALATNIDAPISFNTQELTERIEFLATQPDYSSNAQHISPMTLRLRTILADERIRSIVARNDDPSLVQWLEQYLGNSESAGLITIVDLSLIPTDVLHTAVSVIGRLIFEAVQRYRKQHQSELPTVLVLEEAHNFVAARAEETDIPSSRQMCKNVFERIAREGRKFGLSLVLSSQRPSELSQTVLAQCNSFLLHRLVNDIDQALVKRLVPDALGDLLGELPALPSRRAILLGWASQIPTLVQISQLAEEHQPQSRDPHFWDVWRAAEPRPGEWKPVVDRWT